MALTKVQLVDLNANELIIDLDADTSITADTDDQIDMPRCFIFSETNALYICSFGI